MDSKGERVPLKEVADILGMSTQAVRIHMQKDLFEVPIGFVTNPSGNKRDYHIYRHMLNQHLGVKNGRISNSNLIDFMEDNSETIRLEENEKLARRVISILQAEKRSIKETNDILIMIRDFIESKTFVCNV